MISRRRLFQAALGAAAATRFGRFGLVNAYAATSSNYRALVCVFLFGGNDSNNTVVPLDTARFNEYTNIRKNLALPQSSLLPIQTTAGETYGLHGKLPELKTLFDSKKLAIVANVGTLVQPLSRAQFVANQAPTPSNLFSHSDQQTEWQTSVAKGVSATGWGGRLADQVAFMNSPSKFPTLVSVTGNAIYGTGAQTTPTTITPGAPLGLNGFDNSAASTARMNSLQELLTLSSGATLVQQAGAEMTQGLSDSSTLARAMNGAPPLKTVFPANNTLAAQLQEVAKIIQVRQSLQMNRQIFFCSLGGFDTHTNQLNDQDTLYGRLSPAVSAFYQAMQELQVDNDVTLFTESDFSRTLQPNSNGGTDHAWGSHHMVVGGAVKGGALYGSFPAIVLGGNNDAGSEGRWIPTTAVDQYGATFASWFGVADNNLGAVFPNLANFPAKNVGFLS